MFDSGQGHLLHFSQKPSLVDATYRCDIKVMEVQEATIPSEINSVLFEGTIGRSPGNKGFFTYPLSFPREWGEPLHLLHCQRLDITLFLCVDNVLILANSFSQAKKVGQRIVHLLQGLHFILSLKNTSRNLLKSPHT